MRSAVMGKRIISVVSGKGGVGKSTIAVNLATLLSRAGISTVLIDADVYNPCVFFHLGLSPQSSGLQELLDGSATLDEVLPIHPSSGLRCISSSMHSYSEVKTENLGKLLEKLDYEFVFIDCPPGFSKLIEKAVEHSSDVFVMMTPDMPSCTAALKLVSFVKMRTRNRAKGSPEFTFFLNRVANAPYEIHPREVETIFKTRLGAIIPEDSMVPKSISAKTPLVFMSPGSKFSRTIKKFASELLGGMEIRGARLSLPAETAEVPAGEERGGFFEWLGGGFQRLFRR